MVQKIQLRKVPQKKHKQFALAKAWVCCAKKAPEQDVVELDVAVVGLVLAGPLHEVDELFLAVDVHADSEEVLVTRC